MIQRRPGILAVRALNDYRKRNLFGYLALRHYLSASAAQSDEWVRNVAVKIVLEKTNPSYFRVQTFKEISENGTFDYRPLHIPGPNEILAETYLLSECAKRQDVFRNPSCVFSYELEPSESRAGSFQPYINGLTKRHEEIAKSCKAKKNVTVQYMDIRKFYPTIKIELATKAWRRFATKAGFGSDLLELGDKILIDHSKFTESGILTGPMFSHFIANLLLREYDEFFSRELPVKYIRYVDDITLIGAESDLSLSDKRIQSKLENLGLTFHPAGSPKHLTVQAKDWLVGENDFNNNPHDSKWIKFIGDLKKFLVRNPENRYILESMFNEHEIRIPLTDYSKVIKDQSFLQRLMVHSRKSWFRNKVNKITDSALLHKAFENREFIYNQYMQLLNQIESVEGYERKRRVSKLRYNASRLIYLLDAKRLADLASKTRIPEMYFHVQIMNAIAKENLDTVIQMGANAAQAFAQPMKNVKSEITLTQIRNETTSEQAAAILKINGMHVNIPNSFKPEKPGIFEISSGPIDVSLMKSEDPFISELASLHGISDTPSHSDLLNTAFDEDEQLTLDAIDLLQQYDSL